MADSPRGQTPAGWVPSLSLGLFLGVFGVIILTFSAHAFFSIRTTSRQWNHTVQGCAQRFSELIKRSTHYSMLLNRKEDVHQTIRAIAAAPGVEGVRVYDKNGVIIFSAAAQEIGTQVDLQAEACVSCHASDEPLHSVPEDSRARTFHMPGGERLLGLIDPIRNAPECSAAPCHAHPPDQSILGVLDVRMSMAKHDEVLSLAKQQAVVGAVLTALLAGLFSAAFILRLVRRPVRQLIDGADKVAGGDLRTEIPVSSRNEMGQLASAFNHMTSDLRKAEEQLREWSNGLEDKLREKTAELGQSQRQVAHMDKMASLGKLAATVAHELNNPLAGILNYAKLVERTLGENGIKLPEEEELRRYLSLIQKEATRSGMIVRNLLLFARRSGAEFTRHSLKELVDRSVMLVRHHMEMAGIQLEMQSFDGDDHLVCDGDQIQQAMVALLVNAIEAMSDGGTLTVTANTSEEKIRVSVGDTGVGIPTEAVPHIFEPFFSSKDDTHGAGLGLAVVYGIVQRHQGKIEVDSRLNEGTRFDLTLPRHPAEDPADEAGGAAGGEALKSL